VRGPLPDGTLPWTRSCFVCGEDNPRGFRLKSRIENGVVVLTYTPRPSDLGYRHLVHGGLAMTLLDEVMTWAAIVAARRVCVAAEMTTRLKHPVAVGSDLRVEGIVTEQKSRMLLTAAKMIDPEGRELVTATGKYIPVSQGETSLCSEDFVKSEDALPLELILPEPAD